MPTILERDLLEFKRAVSAGDISTQTYDQLVRKVTVIAMTPTERIVYEETKARHEIEDQQKLIILRVARAGGDNLSSTVLTQKDSNPIIKELRAVSLSGDWDKLFQLIPLNSWGYKGAPLTAGVAFPLGKFRFNWGADGKPVYVPFSEQELINYVVPQRVFSQPIMYQCPAEQYEQIAVSLFAQQQANERQYPASDWRYVLPIYPRSLLCQRPSESLWLKIRYPVLIAIGVVAAIYLGPVVMDKLGALMPGGGTGTATAVSEKATLFAKIKTSTETALGYVNKARTIEAIAKGELPPPPISIVGNSFREWVTIVAKKELEDAAIEKAMEMGQEYIAKKMTAKEEAALQAEIAKMQAELIALMPPDARKMPPEPNPDLSAHVKRIQAIEEKRAFDLQKFIIPGAIVAGLFLFGGF